MERGGVEGEGRGERRERQRGEKEQGGGEKGGVEGRGGEREEGRGEKEQRGGTEGVLYSMHTVAHRVHTTHTIASPNTHPPYVTAAHL